MSFTKISCQALGISHGDFFRIIPRLFPEAALTVSKGGVTLEWGREKAIEITIGEEKKRVLGLLEFPTTDVYFAFSNCSSAFTDSFMTIFHRGFQKGGG